MNASIIDILDKFLVVIWPMLRLSAFLAFTSIFSMRAVNMRIRVLLGFAMAFFVSQQIQIPRIDPLTADGLMEIARQILIGLTMGLVFQIASAALVVAGQAISASMGLTIANMIDPNMGNVPVLSQFFNITIPQIRPTIFFTVVTSTIGGLQIFAEPFQFGGGNYSGGASGQFRTVTLFLFDQAFSQLRLGYSSAIAIGLSLIIAVVVGINFFISNKLVKGDK